MKIKLSNWFKSYSGSSKNRHGETIYMPRFDFLSVFLLKKNKSRRLSIIIFNIDIGLYWEISDGKK